VQSKRPITEALRIDGGGLTLVLAPVAGAAPRLVWLGATLDPGCDIAALAEATKPPRRGAAPDADPGITIFPEGDWGFGGEPAVILRTSGETVRFDRSTVEASDGGMLARLHDDRLSLRLEVTWTLGPEPGLLTARTALVNDGGFAVGIERLTALALPLPDWADTGHVVDGRWASEFRLTPVPLAATLGRTGRGGRTGFEGSAYAIASDGSVDDEQGRVIAAHVAWSGESRWCIDTIGTGARHLQIGAALRNGQIVVPPGGRFETPAAYAVLSGRGWNGVRAGFHALARRLTGPLPPRRVHFNSWEAVYFDFDADRLLTLIDAAADVGAERFVLDDGWFAGRRDDSTSLGDWRVDPERFPKGLGPVIAHAAVRGMDFGLWVEPEMVSPDSDLYRAHPDWCLHAPGRDRPSGRGQLALDLARPEVQDHLFEALSALLHDSAIAYLKWDHNRDLYPVAAPHAQTLGLYDLLDRLRAAHPAVEIESCASGGGRVDYGMLGRCQRFWASDSTDALERLRLHRAMSLFYPPELIGAHVGASPNPITGRRAAMDFRARVAMVAHMGIEADPRRMDADERASLASHVALYKRHRALLHDGVQHWTGDAQIVVALDRSEALALFARADAAPHAFGSPLRIPGLDPARRYRAMVAGSDRALPVLDGGALSNTGLRLPFVQPETAWLVHFEAVAG
jgi:alpha-galactosidase